MSIFGPYSPSDAVSSRTPRSATLRLQDQEGVDEYAKKSLVDLQDARRVLKTGDTMTGDLSLGGNKLRGLPTTYPPVDYQGDEAASWNQVVRVLEDAIGGSRVGPRQKPLVTVWAEENGPLDGGQEWSFGNGSHKLGFPMPVPGRVKAMTLFVVPEGAAAQVSLVVNERVVPGRAVSKSASQRVGIVSWDEAYELGPGDTISFSTTSSSGVRATGAIVDALIELDV